MNLIYWREGSGLGASKNMRGRQKGRLHTRILKEVDVFSCIEGFTFIRIILSTTVEILTSNPFIINQQVMPIILSRILLVMLMLGMMDGAYPSPYFISIGGYLLEWISQMMKCTVKCIGAHICIYSFSGI